MFEKKGGGKEDYLRIIYELDDESGKGVRGVDIARQLKISKASVSEMLRKLAAEKLVRIKPYSKVQLTRIGRIKAGALFDRHFTLKRFLKKILKDEDKIKQEAHDIEHSLSIETAKILELAMENKPFEEPAKILTSNPGYIG